MSLGIMRCSPYFVLATLGFQCVFLGFDGGASGGARTVRVEVENVGAGAPA